ncbi:GerW family sporulation protein [Hathewaya histolytica]|uniref:Sporulation protein YtfJ n=1 Tax=Hathewaya histolytica TaxID=1498 RepID=A0A4U9R9W9_HATHI|nr:GerW family sporulation protein [Hathewaya histolytica]VTQ88334.1 sporulation protein YtfJ [Hathewaya histolytica]
MNNHPIDNLLKNTMENLKSLVDVNTIVGDAFTTSDGSTIIPVSKVSMGFASAGTEFPNAYENENNTDEFPFGGGSGGGLSVKPVAFLIIKENKFRMIPLNSETTADRIIDSVPQLLEIIKDMCGDKKEKQCTQNSKKKYECDENTESYCKKDKNKEYKHKN